jgi:hypothetical protein
MYAYGSTKKSTRLLAEITCVLLRGYNVAPQEAKRAGMRRQTRIALSALLSLRRIIGVRLP